MNEGMGVKQRQSIETLNRVGHSNVVRALMLEARTWEPFTVNITTPSYSPTSAEFLEDVMRFLDDPYADRYLSTFRHINDAPPFGDGRYVVMHSIVQHVPSAKHEDVKNDRLSSMTGNGGVWYGNALVLRTDGNELCSWTETPRNMNDVLETLEEYIRNYQYEWVNRPATMALHLQNQLEWRCWKRLHGSRMTSYYNMESGTEDAHGVDGLDHINEIRSYRYELIG